MYGNGCMETKVTSYKINWAYGWFGVMQLHLCLFEIWSLNFEGRILIKLI